MQAAEQLGKWIAESRKIVFFGGAGVSTESGVPDFRSKDGLYNEKWKLPPEEIISHHYFMQDPDGFYEFYRERMLICLDVAPNPAHIALAKWEREGKLQAVVTQNIDGLHQRAGSQRVYELHGSVMRNYCMDCGHPHTADYVRRASSAPRCEKCGGIVKPDVVLYEESLPDQTVRDAISAIASADLLLVGGTSLVVYPAAGLLHYFRGDHLVMINKTATAQDSLADLVLQEPIGNLFSRFL